MKLYPALSFLTYLTLSSTSFASTLNCHSSTFPAGMGSDLQLQIGSSGYPQELKLTLHDQRPFHAEGNFRGAPPVPDETGVKVTYFSWYAGSGTEEETIPHYLVIYAFPENYAHDKSLFFGTIVWSGSQKIETHYHYDCE